ncbi:MAG: hypothetical protein JXR25_16270 [Pontiellaceae bacterium]|nr:hypothetical protein [Pontiellaceae bacterium]MBN2786377.1 hypothetical protein [Pontiellaceae bacterium]
MKSVIVDELKHHGPFTLLGALIGVVGVLLLQRLMPNALQTQRVEALFEFSHPLHVFLSALVTAAVYKNYRGRPHHSKTGMIAVVLVGYFGSIGIATLSDCIVPYWGELLMGWDHAHAHIGIIEMPVIINLAALLGIGGAFFSSQTHFSHGGHVLLSTAASLFHMLRVHPDSFSISESLMVTAFLFLAVWGPCCLSDIVFPLIFTRKES